MLSRYKATRILSRNRNKGGTTLVEMTVVIGIMAMISTAIFGILISTLSSYRKLENETSSVQVVRNAINRIGQDVRMARALGDVFGVSSHTTFPDFTNNPLAAGYIWPAWSDATTPSSFTLNGNTLIVQIPIFDANGFPLQVTSLDSTIESDVETHVYRVLHRAQDPADEYVLEYIVLPGANSTITQKGPSVIATGIIGPIVSGNTVPQVFQYIDKSIPPNVRDTFDAAESMNIADYTTVAINLEIRKHEATAKVAGKWKDAGIWAVKQEVYMRNNAQATTTNTL